jgi:hypothetical protein
VGCACEAVLTCQMSISISTFSVLATLFKMLTEEISFLKETPEIMP